MVKSTPSAVAERCSWCLKDPLYIDYHDNEWGMPERDERALFERLVLEGMQAGLSWLTILKKRAHMRSVFHDFDPGRLARCTESDVGRWLEDPGVIRHRGKLEAMVGNARSVVALNGGFSDLIWSFVGGEPVQNGFEDPSAIPARTGTSEAMARTLKSLGFAFVGPTTCYAFMQSAGLVNDHFVTCPQWARCRETARSERQ